LADYQRPHSTFRSLSRHQNEGERCARDCAAHRINGGDACSKRRVTAELARRTQAELGDGAGPLDCVISWLEHGGLLADLARDLERSMEESVSRRWLSFVVHRLAPDAAERIAAARSPVLASAH
jgi:hypothetical protein